MRKGFFCLCLTGIPAKATNPTIFIHQCVQDYRWFGVLMINVLEAMIELVTKHTNKRDMMIFVVSLACTCRTDRPQFSLKND